MDAAHNPVLKKLLLDLEASVSIAAPAHPWGENDTMAAMERRALHDHEHLVDAIVSGRPDEADAIARAHVAIDFELIAAAMRRAGVPTDQGDAERAASARIRRRKFAVGARSARRAHPTRHAAATLG